MTVRSQAAALPLAGLKVLVTRPAHQAEALSSLLREAGATPVELPVIEIVPVDAGELAVRLQNVAAYDWLVFTSVNTVSVVAPLLSAEREVPKVAAIGDATASALRGAGIRVDLVPESFVAEAVVEAMAGQGIAGARVLLPRAEVARDALPEGLRITGALVDVVPVYRTRMPNQVDGAILASLRAGEIDIVTFTSPSTVQNLLELTGGSIAERVRIACIGPVTAEAAARAGLRVDIVADMYTVPGLVQALVENEGLRP